MIILYLFFYDYLVVSPVVLIWRTAYVFPRRGSVPLPLFWRSRAPGVGGLTDGCGGYQLTIARPARQRLSRLLPLHWYARNASCQQMLLTHDDALGIRMDAASNFNPGTKRHYSRVNPVSLVRNSFVYRNHAEIVYRQNSSTLYSLGLPHCQLVLGL